MQNILYFGGNIITMEEQSEKEQSEVKGVLVENGVIQKVGDLESIFPYLKQDTIKVDLKGNTLMPAFIDAHSHLTALATSLRMIPLAQVKNFDQLVEAIKEAKSAGHIADGQWIIGFGYDHNFFEEKKHPTKQLLDMASSDNPILISHVSGHMGVLNTLGLEQMGIDKNTPNPVGGIIGKEKDGITPNGYLEETAFTAMAARIPSPSLSDSIHGIEQAQNIYFQNGITTIQDGLVKAREWEALQAAAEGKKLLADVVGYVDLRDNSHIFTENKQYKKYKNRLKLGGYKIFLDGSPQSRTAWVTQPYLNAKNNDCGYPIYNNRQVETFIKTAFEENAQILVHCNGDAAAQQMIQCYENVKSLYSEDIRPVMIHAQLVQKSQLKKMAELNMIASFFIAHTYYWGDIHITNLGQQRAFAISPARSAIALGVMETFHQDSPVIAPNMLETIGCAVNRLSRNHVVMGESEKISVYQALQAVTLHAAYQYFEEDKKGSLKEGKLADMVILNQNPLTTHQQNIKNIIVLETIKEGKTVYKRNA